ncbi:hypothetical protein QBC38DRAFT_439117 [Podospora fimiseda]|uniref:Fungal N-terminal domain-containing protein n=1 Tax=Podospora fimiseda TaxID=252190 RepID=A0AAN7H5M6_9PEZI|nr:hypothetical protein QBC38DRAFT_439117 [Podospora fimiseda]
MEIVGVVAAVPALAKLAKHLVTTIGQITSKSVITKAASGLCAQLELLSGVLESIYQRDIGKKNACGNPDSLKKTLDGGRQELEEVMLLVDKIQGSGSNGPRFLQSARLVLTGFESQLISRSQRIDRVIRILQAYLDDVAAQARLEAQVRKLLKPSTTTANFIPVKLDGTLEWVWTHDKFLEWTGSTAAASVADELRRTGIMTFFFSFWSGHSHDMRSEVIFRTILWQLIEQAPADRQRSRMAYLLENKAELRDTGPLINQIKELGVEYGQVDMENAEASQITLPPSFWDEMIQLGISHQLFNSGEDEENAQTSGFLEILIRYCMVYGFADGLATLTEERNVSGQISSQKIAFAEDSRDSETPTIHQSMAAKEKRDIEIGSLKRIIEEFMSQSTSLRGHRLALILAPVQQCLSKIDGLINPFDISLQALRGLGFMALMGMTMSLKDTMPQQALNLSLLALKKSSG